MKFLPLVVMTLAVPVLTTSESNNGATNHDETNNNDIERDLYVRHQVRYNDGHNFYGRFGSDSSDDPNFGSGRFDRDGRFDSDPYDNFIGHGGSVHGYHHGKKYRHHGGHHGRGRNGGRGRHGKGRHHGHDFDVRDGPFGRCCGRTTEYQLVGELPKLTAVSSTNEVGSIYTFATPLFELGGSGNNIELAMPRVNVTGTCIQLKKGEIINNICQSSLSDCNMQFNMTTVNSRVNFNPGLASGITGAFNIHGNLVENEPLTRMSIVGGRDFFEGATGKIAVTPVFNGSPTCPNIEDVDYYRVIANVVREEKLNNEREVIRFN